MSNQGLFNEDISDLRVRLYEEIKHMTPVELNEYINKKVERMYERHGMKINLAAKKKQKAAV
jgi:hypothetical protein